MPDDWFNLRDCRATIDGEVYVGVDLSWSYDASGLVVMLRQESGPLRTLTQLLGDQLHEWPPPSVFHYPDGVVHSTNVSEPGPVQDMIDYVVKSVGAELRPPWCNPPALPLAELFKVARERFYQPARVELSQSAWRRFCDRLGPQLDEPDLPEWVIGRPAERPMLWGVPVHLVEHEAAFTVRDPFAMATVSEVARIFAVPPAVIAGRAATVRARRHRKAVARSRRNAPRRRHHGRR